MSDGILKRYKVPSKSEPGKFQEVVVFDDMSMECTCTAFQYRKKCSHLGIVNKLIEKEKYEQPTTS